MEAKNKMIFGRLENRILRPQEQIADEVRRYVRVRGKEKKDGGRPMWLDLEAKPLTQALEAGKRGDEGITVRHARHPFGRRRMCCAQTAAPEGKNAKRM